MDYSTCVSQMQKKGLAIENVSISFLLVSPSVQIPIYSENITFLINVVLKNNFIKLFKKCIFDRAKITLF